MNKEDLKLCPFCESVMMLMENENGKEPFLECPTCGLKFKLENFKENPIEIKEN